MPGLTITSANSTALITIPTVTTIATQLSQFFVDEAFSTEDVDVSEEQVGVDGYGVAGQIPNAQPQTFSFLASSNSCPLFDAWRQAENTLNDKIYASMTIDIPSVQLRLSMGMGVLKRYSPAPNVRKVLDRRSFGLVWLPNGPGQPAVVVSPLVSTLVA